ncbi:GGDEF domain-containing protein [Planctomycetota bacterium]|nr:GGDEF domain-containing protein [Planctomycetota bacterium]
MSTHPPRKSESPSDEQAHNTFNFDEGLCNANRSAPKVWNDASLRNKVSLIVIASATIGAAVGVLEAKFGHLTWPLFFGLALSTSLLIAFARSWVVSPVDKLIVNVLDICTINSPRTIRRLPTERRDEVGQVARLVQRLATQAVKDSHEISHLRRTLSSRIENATRRACSQLETLANRDPLTDLCNRRALEDNLGPLVAAAKATKTDLLAVMIDMDNFKQINDLLGHDRGDELLTLLANIIRGSIRHDDLPIRLGGDEFLILLPGCPIHRAQQLADNTRKLFMQQTKLTLAQHKLPVIPNLSIGIASLNHDRIEDADTLMKCADERLYLSKQAGKGVTTIPDAEPLHLADQREETNVNAKRLPGDGDESSRLSDDQTPPSNVA